MDQSPSEEYRQQPPRRNRFEALIPKGDYFFTPIIIIINFLIYFAMCAKGVSPIFPGSQDLINWGANMRSLTMNGEWWRMITSMFLHFGILHIATNMFALYSIGRMLEPFIGKWRFLILYLCAGLGGNAVSLWYHDAAAGAGASGAIFGTFGILAALLTTDLIEKSIRSAMLRSISIAIGLNLLIGLNGMIDNSAHIGGLITGAVGGYLCYFDLKAWFYRRKKQFTFTLLTVVFTAGVVFFFWKITPPVVRSDEWGRKFDYNFKVAKAEMDSTTLSTSPQRILKQQIYRWDSCEAFIDSLQTLNDITSEGKKNMVHYRHAVENYRQASQYFFRAATDSMKNFIDSAKDFKEKGKVEEDKVTKEEE